jgi:hypothetical protein
LIVRIDEEVLVLNGWCALGARFDDAVLGLISLAVRVRLFFLCDMLRG